MKIKRAYKYKDDMSNNEIEKSNRKISIIVLWITNFIQEFNRIFFYYSFLIQFDWDRKYNIIKWIKFIQFGNKWLFVNSCKYYYVIITKTSSMIYPSAFSI